MQAGQDVTVGGRLVQAQYQYTLTDNDAAQSLTTGRQFCCASCEACAQLADVASDQQIASPNVSVTVDRDAAYRLGLSMGLIDQTLYDAFGQEQVTTVYTDTSQRKVILEVEPRFQNDPSALSHIYVALCLRGASAAVGGRALSRHGAATDGEPSGCVSSGDTIVQPGAWRFARPSG